MVVIPALGYQRQVDPWGSVASLIQFVNSNERLCLKEGGQHSQG